jgi:hypothetical protein
MSATVIALLTMNDKVAKLLIDHGAAVNAAVATSGQTPLHFAALRGQTEVVQALLAAGANNLSDKEGLLPADLAATSGLAGDARFALIALLSSRKPENPTPETPTTNCYQNSDKEKDKGFIEGFVVDNFGKPIKDVTVAITNLAFMSHSDARGCFTIQYVPGSMDVTLNKTGYSGTAIHLSLTATAVVPLAKVTLLQLPPPNSLSYVSDKHYLPIASCSYRWQCQGNWAFGQGKCTFSLSSVGEGPGARVLRRSEAHPFVFVDNKLRPEAASSNLSPYGQIFRVMNLQSGLSAEAKQSWSDAARVEQANLVQMTPIGGSVGSWYQLDLQPGLYVDLTYGQGILPLASKGTCNAFYVTN